MIDPAWLQEAHKNYVDRWLVPKWGHRDLSAAFPDFVLWYSIAGSAWGSDSRADSTLKLVRNKGPALLPLTRPQTWHHAVRLARRISRLGSTPLEWFTSSSVDLERAWEQLDDVPWVGPKIASFIMRDLSFLRDYWSPASRSGTRGGRRETAWFAGLRTEHKALFVPVDRYVHTYARRHRASPTAVRTTLEKIQRRGACHRAVAEEIVVWSEGFGADPRDVDEYWYSLGAGNIHHDGTEIE